MRRPPHSAVIATSARVATSGMNVALPLIDAGNGVPAPNPVVTAANARAALTPATSADTPNTPNTLASCAIGSTVV